jgi:pimeloyl-ACP methyl ester carboxylesterase
VSEFFADIRVIRLDAGGHFTPLERPHDFAAAVAAATARAQPD